MERMRRRNSSLLWVFMVALIFQNVVLPVASSTVDDGVLDQKTYYRKGGRSHSGKTPSIGGTPSTGGSYGPRKKPPSTYGSPTPKSGGGYGKPAPKSGGGYGTPSPKSGGSHGVPPVTVPSPTPKRGGAYYAPPTGGVPSVGGPTFGAPPTGGAPSVGGPTFGAPPTGGAPSIGGPTFGAPPTVPNLPNLPPQIGAPPFDPGTPSVPDFPSPIGGIPTFPPYFPGTCTFWKTHPALIFGILGFWGTIGGIFGKPLALPFGQNLSLLQALSLSRSDGVGALYREGTASLLNSMVDKRFPFTTQQVKESFASNVYNVNAAAAQAEVFRHANMGLLRPRKT